MTVYEQADHIGGHSNTIAVPGPHGAQAVDMGFIVYNPETYPNLVALFDHLGVADAALRHVAGSSVRGGALVYSGTSLNGLFAQRGNRCGRGFGAAARLRPSAAEATRDAHAPANESQSLGDYLAAGGYGEAFIRDHLLPMAAAIWSTPRAHHRDPVVVFLRFCADDGPLRLSGRPSWRTVTGGSRRYVAQLTASFAHRIWLGCGVTSVRRPAGSVSIVDCRRGAASIRRVVSPALPTRRWPCWRTRPPAEQALLGAIGYGRNQAVMHRDPGLMPRRRAVWSRVGTIRWRRGSVRHLLDGTGLSASPAARRCLWP